LEPWYGKATETLLMPELEDEGEWEVEELQGKRVKDKEPYYLVKWKGWPSKYNQWISAENMANAQHIIY
jgi:hypothetical protein